MLIDRATGGTISDSDYQTIREDLLGNLFTKNQTPAFVRQCHNLDQYWAFISTKFKTYRERRTYIWDEFKPLIEHLEANTGSPSDGQIGNQLEEFDPDYVNAIWQKALERRNTDPEGAITVARTLLETVCKHILDDAKITYASKIDLPTLWSTCATHLNLSPHQYSEQAFRAILGGCQTIVQYLGTLRNQISDAHGQGSRPVKPKPRHAELAVTVSGAMASFLVQTWQEKKELELGRKAKQKSS